jgi:DNA end-binding protein Ku
MAKHSSPRSIWTGSITFGLVSVPVKLFVAVRERDVHFHLVHDQDHGRLQRKMVCSLDGKEVHPEHMIKCYPLGPDQCVPITQEELDAIQPKKGKTIEIEDFVDLARIDPVYFDKTYYVAPQEAGAKAYRLLVEAMTKSKRVGIARFVMRNKEHLAALRTAEGALVLETMHYGDEVLSLADTGIGHTGHKPAERELKVAEQLIESLSTEFDPAKYKDEYREAVEEMVHKKAEGEEVVTAPAPKESPHRVTNLMAALEASLAAAKGASKSGARSSTRERANGHAHHPPPRRRRRSA